MIYRVYIAEIWAAFIYKEQENNIKVLLGQEVNLKDTMCLLTIKQIFNQNLDYPNQQDWKWVGADLIHRL